MTTNYIAARDDIFDAFEAAWNAESAAVIGSVPEIRWQGKEKDEKPAVTAYWVRLSVQTVTESQATLNSQTNGKRRYRAEGLVFAQISCPKSDKNAYERGQGLSVVARNAFRGKRTPGGVEFRNARINELPPESDAFKFNVVANTRYTEIG